MSLTRISIVLFGLLLSYTFAVILLTSPVLFSSVSAFLYALILMAMFVIPATLPVTLLLLVFAEWRRVGSFLYYFFAGGFVALFEAMSISAGTVPFLVIGCMSGIVYWISAGRLNSNSKIGAIERDSRYDDPEYW
ncbi:hypothetical protein [Roseibium sp.]|uniref:hypothetical protein n=1 Tax=Roseibium sp. TaxID=1936156 RepID=UPI003BAC126C